MPRGPAPQDGGVLRSMMGMCQMKVSNISFSVIVFLLSMLTVYVRLLKSHQLGAWEKYTQKLQLY